MPAGTTTRPSGLSRSEATFATNFDVATPTEAVRPPVTSVTVTRTCSASARTDGSSYVESSETARSTNASSSDSGSTRGDRSRRTAITAWLASR